LTTLLGLRRADPADLLAVTALQHAAYAKNRPIIGIEPLPLTVDYAEVLTTYEVWLAERNGNLDGVLILEPRSDDLLLWSIAVSPAAQGCGLGNRLLDATDERARELSFTTVRLYTGEKLVHNIAWYERHGFVRERLETLGERRLVHMVKYRKHAASE